MSQKINRKTSVVKDVCVEEAFFKTILICAFTGSAIVVLLDLAITSGFNTISFLNFLLILVAVVGLCSLRRIHFKYVTATCVLAMTLLFGYRELVSNSFMAVDAMILIGLGFVCSLTQTKSVRIILQVVISATLAFTLFKKIGDSQALISIRQSVPYLIIYFIVTISSGILKDQYERNQKRLTKLVDLLNYKNAKINSQHAKLLKSHNQLADLNENLEQIVKEKTDHIQEKNKQLAEVAFANAHEVRGPLARILGLIHLSEIDAAKKETYFSMIADEAVDMDRIIHKVGRTIEQNMLEEKPSDYDDSEVQSIRIAGKRS